MDMLKRLLGLGGGSAPSRGGSRAGDPNGIYLYVQPNNCEEVVRVRIDRNNDLSLADDNKSYQVHKLVRGTKCFESVNLYLYFDGSRRMKSTETVVENGELVDQDSYDAWIAQLPE